VAQSLVAEIQKLGRNIVAHLRAAARHEEIAVLGRTDMLPIHSGREMLFDRDYPHDANSSLFYFARMSSSLAEGMSALV
jgi:hypothetical protein